MNEEPSLYQKLLSNNHEAFDQHLFIVAYHALAAAMHCATGQQDAVMLEEIEQRARDQWQYLKNHFTGRDSANEPLELALYSSLWHLAYTRRRLLSGNST